jgi:hypothetical protein
MIQLVRLFRFLCVSLHCDYPKFGLSYGADDLLLGVAFGRTYLSGEPIINWRPTGDLHS